MVIQFDTKYTGMPRQSWVNNSFFPDLPTLDFNNPVDALVKAGSALAMMTELAPQRSPLQKPLPGGLGGGLGPRTPLSPYAGAAFTILALAATAREVYRDYTHAPDAVLNEPAEEPDLDTLRRMLEDAERRHRELEKQTPAWYENPFSKEVTRHHARLSELALWIERLKLEIELKEWEEVRDVVRVNDPNASTALEDRRIAELKQRIETHSTHSEKSLGALGGIVASANGETAAAAPADKNVTGKETDASEAPETASAVLDDYSLGGDNHYTVALRITDGEIAPASIREIEAIRSLIPDGKVDVKVHVTHAMPDQVSDWQYRWLDTMIDIIERQKPMLRLANILAKNGLPPPEILNATLQRSLDETRGQLDRYNAENAALQWVNIHLFPTAESESMGMAIGAAIHNSQPAWANLTNHAMLIEGIMSGDAVPDSSLEPTPKVVSTSLDTVTKEALSQARAELQQNGVRVMVDIKYPTARFLFAPQETKLLVGILTNMMGNAGRYSDLEKPDRILLVSASVLLDGGLEMTCADNGIGMSPEFVRHRLGKNRVQEGRMTVARSSGQGVWSVFQDAKKLGLPPVQVKSVEREGSAFRVIIPADRMKWPDGPPTATVNRQTTDIEEGYVIPDAAQPK